jgi:hypothetical protein
MSRSTARVSALAMLFSLAAATPVLAGPPWISIQLPANPLNSTTRGAFLLVNVYHHGDPMAQTVTGTATGIVDGQRRTLKLAFQPTNLPAVLALRQSWPSEGTWALAITVDQHGNGPTALVGIENGEVRSVKVPTQTKNGNTYGRPVTQRDIDATLQALSSGRDRQELGLAGAAVLLPIGLGIALRRRAAGHRARNSV